MMPMLSGDNNLHGYVAPGWEMIQTKFEQNLDNGRDAGASLCIYYRGECVVNLIGGWKDPKTKQKPYAPDSLQVVFSTSKGVVAAATALCVEKGWLDYQELVSKYWPEFGVNEKEDVVVSDLLSHRAGLPGVDQELTVDDVFDWERITSLLAAQKPYWKPGSTHGYHAFTSGFLAGELIQRVDPQHRSISQFIRDELDPEFYIGVTDDKVAACIAPLILGEGSGASSLSEMDPLTKKSMTCSGAFSMSAFASNGSIFNETRFHQAVIPAANGITNARALARIYALLIGDVHENGTITARLLSDKTMKLTAENVTPPGESDHSLFNLSTQFSRGGFQVFGDFFHVLGEDGFGHQGIGGTLAYASPSNQLAYAYVLNQLDLSALATDSRNTEMLNIIDDIITEKTAA